MDRQTDGQNYDPQDRASIAASRGKSKTDDHEKTVRPGVREISPVSNCKPSERLSTFRRVLNRTI